MGMVGDHEYHYHSQVGTDTTQPQQQAHAPFVAYFYPVQEVQSNKKPHCKIRWRWNGMRKKLTYVHYMLSGVGVWNVGRVEDNIGQGGRAQGVVPDHVHMPEKVCFVFICEV